MSTSWKMGADETAERSVIMSRPRKPYRIYKETRIEKKTGERKESLRWYLSFRDHLDIKQELTGTPNKSTTEHIAKNIVAIVNMKSANQPLSLELRKFIENQPKKMRKKLADCGILDANTNAGFEPLAIYKKVKAPHSKLKRYEVKSGHVYDWLIHMKAIERSKQHITDTLACIMRIIEGCGFIAPYDITDQKIKLWMTEMRNKGKTAKAVHTHILKFSGFIRWMVQTGRLSENPIRTIKNRKPQTKDRPRRALTDEQVTALLTATVDANKHHGTTGHVRHLVYRLALGTGLRYNEIYTLKRKDIVCTGDASCVTVQARNAKNRKCESVPLRPDLAKDLEAYFQANLALPNTRAFPGLWQNYGAKMLQVDLALAGIEYETEDGFADFHALRHTFGTMLARSGVTPQIAQKLMRHSDINLTLKYYTHLVHIDKAKALDMLPAMLPQHKEVKTGTDVLSANLTENPIKIQQNKVKSINRGN